MAHIIIEEVRKTKKNEPKVFPSILSVDKEAFGKLDDQTFILKTFWKSQVNKIIVARKADTKSIIGYACFLEADGGCYLMRIGVRTRCQRGGIGRKIMNYLFEKYPQYLSLDVSADNAKAIGFYQRIGLALTKKYLSEDHVEFCKFETPAGFKNSLTTKIESKESQEQKFEFISPIKEKEAKEMEEVSDVETMSSRSEKCEPVKISGEKIEQERVEEERLDSSEFVQTTQIQLWI